MATRQRADTSTSDHSVAQWWQMPTGKAVFAAENAWLKQNLPLLQGRRLLYCTEQPDVLVLSHSPIARRWRYAEGGNEADVIGSYAMLPFKNDSIDVVLIAHVMEAHSIETVETFVSEIYRVLAPGGYVIMLAFNPYSLLGCARMYRRHLLHCLHFWSAGMLRKLWVKRDATIVGSGRLFYLPEIARVTPKSLWWLRCFEVVGRLCFPSFGDIAWLMIRKDYAPLTPIGWIKRLLGRPVQKTPCFGMIPSSFRSDENKYDKTTIN